MLDSEKAIKYDILKQQRTEAIKRYNATHKPLINEKRRLIYQLKKNDDVKIKNRANAKKHYLINKEKTKQMLANDDEIKQIINKISKL